MSVDTAKDLLLQHGSTMASARVSGYEAEQQIEFAAEAWAAAANTLAKALADETDIPSADEQYECFVDACMMVDIDPMHPALADERETFRIMSAAEKAKLN